MYSTGIGKSYVASAIGNQACILGCKVLYANTAKLFSRLKMAKADGSYIREMAKIEGYDVIDEQTLADAILDRVVHDAHQLELTGESLRRKQMKNILENVG